MKFLRSSESRRGQSEAGKIDINGMMQRCKRINATLRKRRADSPEIKMRRGMEEPVRREIRMQSGQESLKLSFLIPWNRKKEHWQR